MKYSEHHYMDSLRIVNEYNLSVTEYQDYSKRVEIDDGESVKSIINNAGTRLYRAYEWSLKYHLHKMFKSEHNNGRLSWRDFTEMKKFLSSPGTNVKLLVDQMHTWASPAMAVTKIDFDIIRTNVYNVNNSFKHNGKDVSAGKFEESLREIRKVILTYVDAQASLQAVNNNDYAASGSFYELFNKCRDFTSERFGYVLLVDRLQGLSYEQTKALLFINWSLVIDFDEYSDGEGLCACYSEENYIQPERFNLSNPEKTKMVPTIQTPYWFFANGVADRQETIADTERKWQQKYASKLFGTLKSYHSTFTKPIKVIVISEQVDRVLDIRKSLDAVYEDKIQCYILSKNAAYEEFKDYGDLTFSLTYESFANGLLGYSSHFNKKIAGMDYQIPASDGGYIPVRLGDYSHLELLYRGIAEKEKENEEKTNPELYYQGRVPLSWYGAQHGFAVSRKLYASIKKDLSKELESKAKVKIQLIHEPGIGGTSFARELAYNVSKEYPTVVVKAFKEEETALQINNLFNVCKMPILILIESRVMSNDQVNLLIDDLKSQTFNFVILYVKRKPVHKNGDSANGKLTYPLETLDDDACIDMHNKLTAYINSDVTHQILSEICNGSLRKDQKTPFYMSLHTFEEKFEGVKPYITGFINGLTEEQKNILVYIAIADYYAERPLDTTYFTTSLIVDEDTDGSEPFDREGAFENLVVVLSDQSANYYKIRHPLFAKELIGQIVGREEDGSETFVTNLIKYLVMFIRSSRSSGVVEYESSINVLKNLFILKNSNEIEKERFAPLITKIKGMLPKEDNGNGIGLIFKTLAEVYPEEPHFIAHLARFYSHVEGNYNKGIELAQEAIELSEEAPDAILFHICGICLRKKIRSHYRGKMYEAYETGDAAIVDQLVEETKKVAVRASTMFEASRTINNKIAGYISDIEMCIDLVDIGRKLSGLHSMEEFIRLSNDSWYMTYIDRALSLMQIAKNLDDDDFETNKIQAKVNGMEDATLKTIDMWEGYLEDAAKHQKPQIRRFIARAKESELYRNGIEKNLHLIDEIILLMEENIREEPKNPANIRMWFNTIRHCKTKSPEILLDEAIQNLALWKISNSSIEAYYYYFILVSIKAIEGSSKAEAELQSLQFELKQMSGKLRNNTVIYEWLGEGKGIERLFSSIYYEDGKRKKRDVETMTLAKVLGRINYKNNFHAYLHSNQLDIFFNPSVPVTKILEGDDGKMAEISFGFSYDGPRAYNRSAKVVDRIETPERKETVSKQNMAGKLVKCRVLRNAQYYTKVRLVDYMGQYGSIRHDLLSDDYGKDKLPIRDSYLFASILYLGTDSFTGKEIWQLTMKRENDGIIETKSKWQKDLETLKNRFEDGIS
ncbi:hypothetical protein [Cohnella sp.]|uniref:hypothetical protein n=1 Tax=Cohnella sp. TaxID=1883426 RepID=UPI003566E029